MVSTLSSFGDKSQNLINLFIYCFPLLENDFKLEHIDHLDTIRKKNTLVTFLRRLEFVELL